MMKKLCEVPGCDKPSHAARRCSMHYTRAVNYGWQADDPANDISHWAERKPYAKPKISRAGQPSPETSGGNLVPQAVEGGLTTGSAPVAPPRDAAVAGDLSLQVDTATRLDETVIEDVGQPEVPAPSRPAERPANLSPELLAIQRACEGQVITADLTLSPSQVVGAVYDLVELLKNRGRHLDDAAAALDSMPCTVGPELDSLAKRIRYATSAWLSERKEASELATLCDDAHAALDAMGVPAKGAPAARIRAFAQSDRPEPTSSHALAGCKVAESIFSSLKARDISIPAAVAAEAFSAILAMRGRVA